MVCLSDLILLCLLAHVHLCASVVVVSAAPLSVCLQASVDGISPKPQALSFQPEPPMRGFYQWQSNNGYCGEVSLIQSAMGLGTWISQFNSRSIATTYGPKVTQTGSANGANAKLDAQMLLSLPDETAISFEQATKNLKLVGKAYPSANQKSGLTGYKDFLSWIKAELILRRRVTIGVKLQGGEYDEYDHIVNVVRVDTVNATAGYLGTDVMYIDDHGTVTLSNRNDPSSGTDNPAVPPGSGADTKGCTPFIFGYTFDAWRGPMGAKQSFMIPLPTKSIRNYAYSISGIADTQNMTKPVVLTMTSSQPYNPICGYQYEAPYIGTSRTGDSSTNAAPAAMPMTVTATVSGLTPGRQYRLYQYRSAARPLIGPITIPTSNFNAIANAKLAFLVTNFTATGTTYQTNTSITSNVTVAFRCVPVTAP